MSIEDTLTLASKSLQAANIEFALIGGFALVAHGVVRATVDIDFLVDGNKKKEAKECLVRAGFNVAFESEEVLQLSGKGQLDLLFANRPASRRMLENSKIMGSFPVKVVSAEDIIGLKIQAYSNDPKREFQDKADIQALMEKNANLDYNLIRSYADLFDQWGFIEMMKARL